ncbi:MAG: glycine C-acetyltransferase [Bradymonadia bacterium]
MHQAFLDHLSEQLEGIKAEGLYKEERIIVSPQQSEIEVAGGQKVINLCANNYLGLSSHPELLLAAHRGLDRYGYGMSSVRFICGTQDVHTALEAKLSSFLGTEDTILFSSAFDANSGLFEPLLTAEDAVISDALNHACIIDGIRLCKAKRFRYKNNDMADLEANLKAAVEAGARHKIIVTDGVFSMDGYIAQLDVICDLADKYDALVAVDDSHAVGFIGANGRGTPEYRGVLGRVDIITGTLGKALGGASGGYVAARKPIVEMLRQRARPYLFSNTLAPVIAATSLHVLEMLEGNDSLRTRLRENSIFFRQGMTQLGFNLLPGEHPIIPVMLGDAVLAQKMSAMLLEEGIYVIGFSYPVVPRGEARIRTQMSAAHGIDELDRALKAFEKVGKALDII